MARKDPNRHLIPMYVGTKMLRNRRVRVSEFGGVQLPRAVDVMTLVCTIGGAVIMLVAALLFRVGLTVAMWAAIIGGAGGYFFATWEPLPGHSLWRYFSLMRKAKRRRQVSYQGREAQIAIGIARVTEAPRGRTHILAGCVNFDPSNVDPSMFQRKPAGGAGLHNWLEIETGDQSEIRTAPQPQQATQMVTTAQTTTGHQPGNGSRRGGRSRR